MHKISSALVMLCIAISLVVSSCKEIENPKDGQPMIHATSFQNNEEFYEMSQEDQDATMETWLTNNQSRVTTRLNLLAKGLIGAAKNPEVATIVDDYVQARKAEFLSEDEVVLYDSEFPFIHLYVLKQLCDANDIDLVDIIQDELAARNATTSEIDMIPTIVDSFEIEPGVNFWVFPTIMVPFYTEARSATVLSNDKPNYISVSQYNLDEASMSVWSYSASDQNYVSESITDFSRLYTKRSWDLMINLHKPLVQFRSILVGPPTALRAICDDCDCSNRTSGECVNNVGTSWGCAQALDHSCIGECAETFSTCRIR